jgi:diacylglycerol kinase family enzyme
MSRYQVTLCTNTKARQFDKSKLAELESVFKDKKVAYNVRNPLSLQSGSASNLGAVLVAVGGDGTVNLVAQAALKYNRKLAVVPQGTFNHFAKDLGVKLEMSEAAQRTISGRERRVDIGQVNDQFFLNNSVIGFYPHLVAKRESLQGALGKWPALVVAAVHILFKIRRYTLRVKCNREELQIKTSLLFIANNKYDLEGFGLAGRHILDKGELYMYVVKSKSLFRLMGISLRLLTGKATSEDFDCYKADQIEVSSRKATLRVALDGETMRLKTPLRYKSLHKQLTVVV